MKHYSRLALLCASLLTMPVCGIGNDAVPVTAPAAPVANANLSATATATAAPTTAPVTVTPVTAATPVVATAPAAPVVETKKAAEKSETVAGQTTNIQNNNITLGQPSVISITPANQLQTAPAVAYRGQHEDDVTATSVLGTKAKVDEIKSEEMRAQITPMAGTSGYTGDWFSHVTNSYTFGLGVEIPLSRMFSFEGEGGMGRYAISYSSPQGNAYPISHFFNQYTFGGNLKVYLVKSWIRPYVGAGLLGQYYENMSTGYGSPQMGIPGGESYNHLMGAGQLIAGADVPVASGVAIGARGAWVLPLINRPATQDNGYSSMGGFEEAAAMNTSMYKAMGTVSIAF